MLEITDIIREWIIRRPSSGSDNCAAEGEKISQNYEGVQPRNVQNVHSVTVNQVHHVKITLLISV
jgi:hypothetical protein